MGNGGVTAWLRFTGWYTSHTIGVNKYKKDFKMPLYATIGHLINKTVLKNTTNSDCKRVERKINVSFIWVVLL